MRVKISLPVQQAAQCLAGRVRVLIRPYKLCQEGDTFSIYGGVFMVTGIYPAGLEIAARRYYRDAGYPSPGAFRRAWQETYGDYIAAQEVYLHIIRPTSWEIDMKCPYCDGPLRGNAEYRYCDRDEMLFLPGSVNA